MLDLLKSRWFRLGAPQFAVGAAVGAAVIFLVLSGDSSDSSGSGRVLFTAGGSTGGGGAPTQSTMAFNPEQLVTDLPPTAAEAVAAGWTDPALCASGRGRYFYKDAAAERVPYLLMYDNQDQLIGTYLYSESEMPLGPWQRMEDLLVGGRQVIDVEHWGMFVYFQDPTRACTSQGNQGNIGNYNTGSAARSTPTPYVPPTPTPSSAATLGAVALRMASIKTISFTLSAEPNGAALMAGSDDRKVEGRIEPPDRIDLQVTDAQGAGRDVSSDSLAFAFADLGATLAGIAGAMQDPVDAPGEWIDNIRHRGISGAVLGQDIVALFPAAVPDARLALSVWVGEDDLIRRVRIEGAITSDDAQDAVRVLALDGFD